MSLTIHAKEFGALEPLKRLGSRALHGNTPFFMVYGSEAVLPADLKFGAPRLIFESISEAEATRLEDIDVLEEEQLNAVIQSARYQQTLRRYHDKVVRCIKICSSYILCSITF